MVTKRAEQKSVVKEDKQVSGAKKTDSDLVLSEDHAPPEATVKGPSVQHDGVLDVVAGVRHHRNRRVLASRNLWASRRRTQGKMCRVCVFSTATVVRSI